ncbi:Ig-like domain-containing protein [Mucilaginibacter sp. OK283]|uniref:Ig-like domain-containing protein n=1 Tax=Mucilaginibacter sp. OK283 TaxID=1881049 RepID=UPI0008CE07AF|nr:Ig-like domain-containing protein [Mucilaginibacter sp. OK283]SEP46152.1 Ig-like domain-containing protein [Mucilaginibacter sp. OK283]
MLNQKPANFYNFFFYIFVALVIFGCAAQQQPQGGPRDVTPPVLVKALPANKTRNFAAKEINLEFDEFIKLANQYTEITMSPTMEKQPEYSANKKHLRIVFKDTLKKNTTYVINFGKGIQDVNESNVMKNFTYVFSTGPHIDSLSISGTVTNTLTRENEKDVTVMLFPLKQDSLLFGKKKPSIFTTTDSSGNFSLNNLHEDQYRIYALKEASPDKIFNNDNELIAFLKKPINLKSDTANIKLNLFKQFPEKFRFSEKRFDVDGKMLLIFNKALQNPSLKIIYPADINNQKFVEFSKTKDTASIFVKYMNFDSIRVAVYDNNKPVDTTYLLKQKKETFVRVFNFKYNISNDKLKPGTDLKITSNLPVDAIDNSQITLKEDSIGLGSSDYTLQKDTGNVKSLTLKYRWRQNAKYELIFNPGAFTDIYGDKNKYASKKFQPDKPENYSSLTLKVTLPDTSKAYVIELLNDQKVVLETTPIRRSGPVAYKTILTGKYFIRVIYDENKNGRWDSGNVHLKKQPENTWVNEKEITLRPNWEAEEPIVVPKEPLTP